MPDALEFITYDTGQWERNAWTFASERMELLRRAGATGHERR